MIPAILPLLRWWPLLVAGVAFVVGWTVQGWRCEAREKAAIEESNRLQQELIERANTNAAMLEREISLQQQRNRDLQGRLSRETRNDAYRCPVPARGVQLINEARTGKAASESNR